MIDQVEYTLISNPVCKPHSLENFQVRQTLLDYMILWSSTLDVRRFAKIFSLYSSLKFASPQNIKHSSDAWC